MPAQRTPAQTEAARRNGARSRGPATPEGKARASANALRHGLAAAQHLLLDGEDRAAYEELLAGLVKELAPATELEGQLVRRLASALWRQGRADRLEAKLFAWTATPKVIYRGRYQEVDAEAAFDVARLAAIQRYQGQLGREVSRLLKELRQLKAEPIAEARNEPEPAPPSASADSRNEPEPPLPGAASRPVIRLPALPDPLAVGRDPAAARPPANDGEGGAAGRHPRREPG